MASGETGSSLLEFKTTEQQSTTENKQKVIDQLLILNQDPTTRFVTFANSKEGKATFAFFNSLAEIAQSDGTTRKSFVFVAADPSFPDTYLVNPKDEKPNQSFSRILQGLRSGQDVKIVIGENGKSIQFSSQSQNDIFHIEPISDRKDGPEIFRKAFEESRKESAKWEKINKQTEAELAILVSEQSSLPAAPSTSAPPVSPLT